MTFYWLPQISICRSLQFPQWEITEVPPLFYDRRTEIKNLTFFEDQRTTHLPTPSLWEAKSTLFSVWFFLWHQKTCVGQQVLWFPIFQKELDFHTTKKEEWSNLRTTFIHISVNILSTNTGIKGEGQFFFIIALHWQGQAANEPQRKNGPGWCIRGNTAWAQDLLLAITWCWGEAAMMKNLLSLLATAGLLLAPCL